MTLPKIVSRDEWLTARMELLAEEKAITRARDAVNARRRGLPMVEVNKEYVFEGANGKAGLPDLFDGCRQLIVYHFMWRWDTSVLLRDGDGVYHTYSSYARGGDIMLNAFNFLDLTPLGRQEEAGIMNWIRHHDTYGEEDRAEK